MFKVGNFLLTFVVVFVLMGFVWTDYSIPAIVVRLVFAVMFSIGFSRSFEYGMKKGEKKSNKQQ